GPAPGGGARAPGRAARGALRSVRCAPGAGPTRRKVLSLSAAGPHPLLRTGLLWLSEQPGLFSIIRGNGLARRLASRFVAGETVEAAVAALTQLNAAGISASLDLLGESVAGA